MLAILNNLYFKFHENLLLSETIQQNHLPFYPFLVSFLYLFIMGTIAFLKPNKNSLNKHESENSSNKNLLRYDEKSSLIIKKLSDKDSQETVLILRKEE